VNFTIATLYLTLKFILELRLHWVKDQESALSDIKKSTFFKLISYKLSKLSFTLCMSVCICYWLLCIGGEALMTFPKDNFFIGFLGVYLHFIIGIIIFWEAFHSHFDFSEDRFMKDFLIFLFFDIVYSVILVSLAKSYEKCRIYPFLSLELNAIILLNIVLIIIFFNVYQMFYFLHQNKNNKNNSKVLEDYLTDESMTTEQMI